MSPAKVRSRAFTASSRVVVRPGCPVCPLWYRGLPLLPGPPVALRGLQEVPEFAAWAHRALAVSASKIAVTEPWWTRNNPENMADIHSVQEFVDELVRRRAALET